MVDEVDSDGGHSCSPPDWGYGPEDGPDAWARLNDDYALCKVGSRQSPIDLADPMPASVPAVVFDYRPMVLEMANNGRTVEVVAADGNSIEVDGARYVLAQFHFHTPSEHTVADGRFAMEIHFVHRNEAGELAVIGAFVRRGRGHRVLASIGRHLPAAGQTRIFDDVFVDASALLPPSRRSYRYLGSLTTPPCSEGVRWIVLETPIEGSDAELAAFESVLGRNSRPIQPLNGRELLIDDATFP